MLRAEGECACAAQMAREKIRGRGWPSPSLRARRKEQGTCSWRALWKCIGPFVCGAKKLGFRLDADLTILSTSTCPKYSVFFNRHTVAEGRHHSQLCLRTPQHSPALVNLRFRTRPIQIVSGVRCGRVRNRRFTRDFGIYYSAVRTCIVAHLFFVTSHAASYK
jgi:hypothetical protein